MFVLAITADHVKYNKAKEVFYCLCPYFVMIVLNTCPLVINPEE